jgi:hypothetical protein
VVNLIRRTPAILTGRGWSIYSGGDWFFYPAFPDYVLKEINDKETKYDKEERKKLNNLNWIIKNRSDLGLVQDINRNNSSLQKDWTIVKSYELPDEISFAV